MQEPTSEMLFYDYYSNWINIFEEGAIRDVTLMKYQNSLDWIKKLVPELKLREITRESSAVTEIPRWQPTC